MSYIRLTHTSASVGTADVSVFFPDAHPNNLFPSSMRGEYFAHDKSRRYKTLWLLHGAGGDFSNWPLNSMIMRYCLARGLVVVMPTIDNRFGLTREGDYMAYLTGELPKYLRFLMPLSDKREDNFVAGLSYGGYFAYLAAMTYPEKYSCAGSFSSPIDVAMDVGRHGDRPFGFPTPGEVPGSRWDIFSLAEKLKAAGADIPRLYQSCGTEDFTWDMNVSARDKLRALGLDHTWEEGPGSHNFEFWDAYLKRFVDWLGLETLSEEGA
ncbi:MAG: alpha/beta hydrolase [Oscillospiraceae bacterium]